MEQRKRTSTKTITVFGKVIDNTAYDDGGGDIQRTRKMMAMSGPTTIAPPLEREDAMSATDLMYDNFQQEWIDPVEVQGALEDLSADNPDHVMIVDDFKPLAPRSAQSFDEVVAGVQSALDRVTIITANPHDDPQVEEYGKDAALDKAVHFRYDGHDYYAI